MKTVFYFLAISALMIILPTTSCQIHPRTVSDPTLNSVSELGTWQIYNYDLGNAYFSPEDAPPPRGEIAWQYNRWGEIHTTPLFKDDTLYVLYASTCTVVTLEANTGKEIWAKRLHPDCPHARSLSLAGDMLYVAIDGILYEGEAEYYPVVYALNKDNGEVIWQEQTHSNWPFYVSQGLGYQVSSSYWGNEKLESPLVEIRDAATGKKLKEFSLSFIKSPRVSMFLLDEHRIYVEYDDNIYAIDRQTHKRVWSFHIERPGGGAIIKDDKLYVSERDGFAVLDTNNGKELLRFEDTEVWGGSKGGVSAVVHNMILSTRRINHDEIIYALDIQKGELQWTYHPDQGIGTPLVIANERVYFGTYFLEVEKKPQGKVYALDLITGELIWELDTPPIEYTPPIIVNGVLYVGASTGEVLAIH